MCSVWWQKGSIVRYGWGCCVDCSRCFVLLLPDFPKLFICFYVMGICKKQGEYEWPPNYHPNSTTFCFFSFLITRLSDVCQNTRVSLKGECWTLLSLIVSFFYCCIRSHPKLSGIKEQAWCCAQDSVGEEFVKGTLGIGCPCFMTSGWSSGKIPRFGVTRRLAWSADCFAGQERLRPLLGLLAGTFTCANRRAALPKPCSKGGAG